MASRPTIAGVVLTLNEESNLARALESLAWCDQLFVIDSGSTDSTPSIAHDLGATLLTNIQSHPFLITEQRNWALLQPEVLCDWVLFLDADELISPPLTTQIKQCIAHPNGVTAFYLCPRYWFLGRWLKRSQGYPNWHPRLLRRGRLRFVGGVWESFSNESRISRIKEPYEHYAFSKGIDDWLERHRRYADWEAEKIMAYLSGGGATALGTRRWLKLRQFSALLWPLRPLLRFTQKYVLQRGFLESWQGLVFALLMAGYDLITIIKVIEHRRHREGLPL